MRKIKKILTILLVVIMMVALLPKTTVMAQVEYEPNDFDKLQEFLNQTSEIAGVTNGKQLKDNYDANDPTTWNGVEWDNSIPKRVKSINGDDYDWSYHSLAGELDVSGFTELTYLNCANNSITSVDITDAIALKELYCQENEITTLITRGATKVEDLDCRDNHLTSLDISGMQDLSRLISDDNELTSLDASNKNKLIRFCCSNNRLTSLNVSGNTSLEQLYCDNNLLTTLDVSGASSLEVLECDHNRLTNLNISGLINLNTLFCGNNQLTTLTTANTDYLSSFDCSGNYLTLIKSKVNSIDITLTAVGKGYVELTCDFRAYLFSIEDSYDYNEGGFYAWAIPQLGADFINWTRDGVEYSISQSIDMYDASVINLVANFSDINTHKVTFDPNSGTRTGGGELVQQIANGGNAVLPVVTRSGYEFSHWDGNYSEVLQDVIVTAQWIPVETGTPSPTPYVEIPTHYQVTFDLTGGFYTGGGDLTQSVLEGDSAIAPSTTRTGYTFMGWDEAFNEIHKVSLIKAIWEVTTDTHVVTFDPNGGTRTGGGELVQKVKNGAGATAPTVSRDGYSLKGWDVAFDNITTNLTVTAIWEENAPVAPITFKVTYDANGGEGVLPIDNTEYVEGDTAILDDGSSLSKDGYEFKGWSLTTDGEAIAFTEVLVNEDVTYYAVWEALEIPEVIPEEIDEVAIPKTGDPSGVYLGIIMLLFGSGIVATEVIRKRKTAKN